MSGPTRIKDLPIHERPRERLAEMGAEGLRDAELIAILLRTGRKGLSVVQIADELVHHFGSLDAVACAPIEELQKVKGIGRDKAVTLKAAFTLAGRLAREFQREDPVFDTPDRVADFLREDSRFQNVEYFHALLLNARRKLIRVEQISQGLVDSIMVHPREVFRAAIGANASSVLLVHNHPSGDPAPSEADIRATRDLIRAGQLLKIEVVDHVILGRRSGNFPNGYVSLRQLGYFHS
jgi:DNA repair protein RadC